MLKNIIVNYDKHIRSLQGKQTDNAELLNDDSQWLNSLPEVWLAHEMLFRFANDDTELFENDYNSYYSNNWTAENNKRMFCFSSSSKVARPIYTTWQIEYRVFGVLAHSPVNWVTWREHRTRMLVALLSLLRFRVRESVRKLSKIFVFSCAYADCFGSYVTHKLC